jgi:hypothetical protein
MNAYIREIRKLPKVTQPYSILFLLVVIVIVLYGITYAILMGVLKFITAPFVWLSQGFKYYALKFPAD